jgi:hypothetical protein
VAAVIIVMATATFGLGRLFSHDPQPIVVHVVQP